MFMDDVSIARHLVARGAMVTLASRPEQANQSMPPGGGGTHSESDRLAFTCQYWTMHKKG